MRTPGHHHGLHNLTISCKRCNRLAISKYLSANIKYLRCLEATLCARLATTTVCTTSQSHHRHQLQALQPAPRYQQISEDRFRLPYNYSCWWTRAHGNGHLGKHVPRQHMGHDVPPRQDADVNALSKAFPSHVVTFPCSSLLSP